MPQLMLDDVPENLYRELKLRAEESKRSLGNEAIACIEAALRERGPDFARRLLARASELDKEARGPLTDDILAIAKNEGRP